MASECVCDREWNEKDRKADGTLSPCWKCGGAPPPGIPAVTTVVAVDPGNHLGLAVGDKVEVFDGNLASGKALSDFHTQVNPYMGVELGTDLEKAKRTKEQKMLDFGTPFGVPSIHNKFFQEILDTYMTDVQADILYGGRHKGAEELPIREAAFDEYDAFHKAYEKDKKQTALLPPVEDTKSIVRCGHHLRVPTFEGDAFLRIDAIDIERCSNHIYLLTNAKACQLDREHLEEVMTIITDYNEEMYGGR